MKKLNCIQLVVFLNIILCIAGCSINSNPGENIPYPEPLDKAAIFQDSVPDVVNNSLLLGNGDLNGLVNVADGKLFIRLSKNDVGDWRNDTSTDSTLIPWKKIRELGAEGKLSTKNRVMGWHRFAYACPIPCGKVVIDLPHGSKNQKTALDLLRAVVRIGDPMPEKRPVATVRCLYQANAFLIEGGTDANLYSHEVEHLPRAEYARSGHTITLYQKLPSDVDWPGMEYAVALVTNRNKTVVSVVSSFDSKNPLAPVFVNGTPKNFSGVFLTQ